MATAEQKKRLLKAKIAIALQSELGRVPKEKEIAGVFIGMSSLQSSPGTPLSKTRAEEERTTGDLLNSLQ